MDVIVHGGAGGEPAEPEDRQATLSAAAVAAAEERTPLDAVEVACKVLEADAAFNAGTGACVQSDGIPRTDAGVMTSDREAGAACAMPGVEHAVTVARVVLEETPHVQVAGVHAVDLAEAFDVPVEQDLWTDRTRERWDGEDAPPQPMHVQAAWVRDRWRDDAPGSPAGRSAGDQDSGSDGPSDGRGDTVGAVARDGDRIAAATSTGGRWAALAGRVGDVPQVGSGFFATDAAGASATGAGEEISKTTLARTAVDEVEAGADAEDAAGAAMERFEQVTDASAGIVVADADGGLGAATNADAMQTAAERR